MSSTKHRLRVAEARRTKHPVYPQIEKNFFLVKAKEMPDGVRTDANARDPEGLNRRVYRDVKANLMGLDGTFPGIFDLMNKGITILAEKVHRLDDSSYEFVIDDGQGIVDGGHTYRIVCECRDDPNLPDDRYVQVEIITGIDHGMISEISRGLNTGMQVRQHSLDNLALKYEWIKTELSGMPYVDQIAWKESDNGSYDVRDLICVLEALNIFDFPNDRGTHPIQAYEKWSGPTKKFSDDYDENSLDLSKSKYYRLRPILKEALVLYDTIRSEFREVYNAEELGNAGALDIVESRAGRKFSFPFGNLPDSEYRLTKGALYPIFAAFRLMVEEDPATGSARWKGGFESVTDLWNYVAPEICRATKAAIHDVGHKPDVLGKNRGHWSNMHKTVELFILRREMAGLNKGSVAKNKAA